MKSISETSNACPACPVEVRDLFAVAHNIIVRMPGIAEGDLKRAVENMQPLIDRHFADRDHSHPRGHKATAPTGSVEGIDLDKLLADALNAVSAWVDVEVMHTRNVGRGGPGDGARCERAEGEAFSAIRKLHAAHIAPCKPLSAEGRKQAAQVSDWCPHCGQGWHCAEELAASRRASGAGLDTPEFRDLIDRMVKSGWRKDLVDKFTAKLAQARADGRREAISNYVGLLEEGNQLARAAGASVEGIDLDGMLGRLSVRLKAMLGEEFHNVEAMLTHIRGALGLPSVPSGDINAFSTPDGIDLGGRARLCNLLEAHAKAVIAAHEHGQTGAYYTDLLSAEQAIIDAIAASRRAAGGARDGFVLVPKEPTPEMVDAYIANCNGNHVVLTDTNDRFYYNAYAAMLAATPSATAEATKPSVRPVAQEGKVMDGWQKLTEDSAVDFGCLVDVVLTNGVYEYERRCNQIDWTQVRDWRYSPNQAAPDREYEFRTQQCGVWGNWFPLYVNSDEAAQECCDGHENVEWRRVGKSATAEDAGGEK